MGKQQRRDSGVLPGERGWCVCWGNWWVCSTTELSPRETDIYSWTGTLLCSPASLQTLPEHLLQGRTGADGGADTQLWGTEKELTICKRKQKNDNENDSGKVFSLLFCEETKTHLTNVPCSMRLDISTGDTSMNRRKEKQLPLSSPNTVKMKTVNKTQQGGSLSKA